MKTAIISAGVIIVILCHSACCTNKFKSRQQEQVTMLEQSNTGSWQETNSSLSYSSTVTDSSGQVYQVTIFPTDTFRFSMKHGFQGMATKIEVRGAINQVTRFVDTTSVLASEGKSTQEKLIRKVEEDRLGQTKSVKGNSFDGFFLRICLLIVVFLLMMYWVMRSWRFSGGKSS